MKTNKLLKTAAFVFSAFLLASCGNDKSEYVLAEAVPQNVNSFSASKKMLATASARASAAVNEESILMEDDYESASGNEISQPVERKIVRNGTVSLEVESLEQSAEKIAQWAASFGGYITNSWESDTSANYTVKIPSEKFDEAFNETKAYGKFLNGNINSDDITDQYYDLETRLDAKKILRTRLQGYLANAKETKELLNIEKELNRVISDIESMEGRLRRMKDQVAYSTININLQLPYGQTETGYDWPSWSDGLRHFAGNVLDFFIGFLQVILYVVICGVPVLAIIALLFWLLFGKVGLVKKLFKKLK